MTRILRINFPVIIIFLLIWLFIINYWGLWGSFEQHWPIALVMLLGAFVAGASCEGGGAVAFPALTLLYGFPPTLAASFSLSIQSFGMSSASYYIIKSKIPVSWRIIRIALPFSFLGFLCPKYLIVGSLDPVMVKLFFVSFWLSFGLVLYWKNKMGQRVFDDVVFKSWLDYAFVVVFALSGGVISAIVGSGVDILMFSLMVLKFHLCEKVAVPTSVILMAGVSVFSSLLEITVGSYDPIVIALLVVALPVVIFMAPVGSMFVNAINRGFIVIFLIGILVVQYIGALYILEVNEKNLRFSFSVLAIGSLFFFLMWSEALPKVWARISHKLYRNVR